MVTLYIMLSLSDFNLGKATGCFVDQSKVETEEDAPVTAYYLWLPYLLAVCFTLARLPRSTWKRFFENGLIRHILKGKSESPTSPMRGGGGQNMGNQNSQANQKKNREIAENFLDFRHRYYNVHLYCLSIKTSFTTSSNTTNSVTSTEATITTISIIYSTPIFNFSTPFAGMQSTTFGSASARPSTL